jgi:uncharacterized protein
MPYCTVAARRFGITVPVLVLVLSSAKGASAASPIDCTKAESPTERTICRTPSLLQADARLAAYFEIATQFVGMGVRGDLYDSQQEFSAQRDKCGVDKSCIHAAYRKQMTPLEAIIDNVKSHGPF